MVTVVYMILNFDACAQLWIPLMSWYVENRRSLEEQVKKYSDPPSEHLLPDLPAHAR